MKIRERILEEQNRILHKALEIALDHRGDDMDMYIKLAKEWLDEEQEREFITP